MSTVGGSKEPAVSIVIPTRNESEDVAGILDACLAMDYDQKEIIVVDDSQDDTPNIVAQYADRGVRLIHRAQNANGCCGARNLGMQMANGEIVVLMNADNLPRRDFLRRLLPHYENGADYVIVRSVVLNTGDLWGRFTQAAGLAWLSGNPQMEWSEGFSCRKAAAAAVGYIPGDFPIPFCRDWKIGAAMNAAGYVKHVDLSIPMEHVVPRTLQAYWHNQVWRGTFSAAFCYYFRRMPVWAIWLREMLKLGRTLLSYALVFPALWRALKVAHFAARGWRDSPAMLMAGMVQDAATRVGNVQGLVRLMHAVRNSTRFGLQRETAP